MRRTERRRQSVREAHHESGQAQHDRARAQYQPQIVNVPDRPDEIEPVYIYHYQEPTVISVSRGYTMEAPLVTPLGIECCF